MILICAKDWPLFITVMVVLSILTAAIVSLMQLFSLKMLCWLPNGQIELQFNAFSVVYDEITVYHQGAKLIILQCKNSSQHPYVLCFYDSFSKDDFGALQRLLKERAWIEHPK